MKWKKLKTIFILFLNGKKLTFNAREFCVRALTFTWQEGEGKYHTNQGNKNNTNVKKIATLREEQHQFS
jgi:hypothetical protein